MGFNGYDKSFQENILDELDLIYSTGNYYTDFIKTKKYFLGCDHVYYIYAYYKLLHTLSDEVDDDKKPDYCHLDKKNLNYLYKVLRNNKINSSLVRIVEKNKNNICSYCFTSKAEEIDHFLVKTQYPSYSISYYNLVPACKSCNHKKGSLKPSSNDEIWFFNPNFESINDEFYLNCKFENNYTKLVFFIDNSKNEIFTHKINFTFSKMKIFEIYERLAHNEIITIFREFEIQNRSLQIDIKKFLLIKRQANQKPYNYLWKRSLYKFLLEETEFHTQGYNEYLKFYNC